MNSIDSTIYCKTLQELENKIYKDVKNIYIIDKIYNRGDIIDKEKMNKMIELLYLYNCTIQSLTLDKCIFMSNNNLFDSLHTLYIRDCYYYDFINYLPINLKCLYFWKGFNSDVTNLPKSLRCLELGSDFNQSINKLPFSLKYLCIGNKFNQKINKLPQLHYLNLGNKFNKSTGNLPDSLISLILGDRYVKQLKLINKNILYLKIGHKFNSNLQLPNSLKYLYLCGCYDQDIILPESLIYFNFNNGYECRTFTKQIYLPDSLLFLNLKVNIFKQNLKNIKFSDSLSLTHLDFGYGNIFTLNLFQNLKYLHTYRLDTDISILPNMIEYLEIHTYEKDIYKLPNNIKYLLIKSSNRKVIHIYDIPDDLCYINFINPKHLKIKKNNNRIKYQFQYINYSEKFLSIWSTYNHKYWSGYSTKNFYFIENIKIILLLKTMSELLLNIPYELIYYIIESLSIENN